MSDSRAEKECIRIADIIVPEYRNGKKSYPCTGTVAKRWLAAFDAATIALTKAEGECKKYRELAAQKSNEKVAAMQKSAKAEILLVDMVRAWEALPGGNVFASRVERWLEDEMSPVVNNIRSFMQKGESE